MGIDKLGGVVTRSSTEMADNAINGTKNAITRIADAVNSDIDSQPTIRPVLDLSEITSGAGAINGLFSMQPNVGVLASVGSISNMMNARQNGSTSDVVSAIKDLKKSVGTASSNTYNINGITYDDGTNVADAVRSLVRAAHVERRR